MANRWFRLYDEILDDPKVQKLSADDFRTWINLLCLASRNQGRLPALEDIAFALRWSIDATLAVVERLLNATLIDRVSGGPDGWGYAPHAWHERQYKSDTSTERVKRFRNVTKALHETASESDTDTDKKSSPIGEPKKAADASRGTRLPDDWALPCEWTDWAIEHGATLAVVIEQADRFRDYWRSCPAAKGRKADWFATWRNWMRDKIDGKPRINGHARPVRPTGEDRIRALFGSDALRGEPIDITPRGTG